MLKEERKARKRRTSDDFTSSVTEDLQLDDRGADDIKESMHSLLPGIEPHWRNAVFPIASVLLVYTVGIFCDGYWTLVVSQHTTTSPSWQAILSETNIWRVVMWSAWTALVVPLFLYWYTGIMSPSTTIGYFFLEGMKDVMEPTWMLIFSFTFGSVLQRLLLSQWIMGFSNSVPLFYLPTLIFILAAITTFCTGSSWSTMAIFIPIIMPLSWGASSGNYSHLVQCISSVLAGSVCGEHSSPISINTNLVCLTTKTPIPLHIKTQFPYTVFVALVSILMGTLPTAASTFYLPVVAIVMGSVVIILTIYAFGTRVSNFHWKEENDDFNMYLEHQTSNETLPHEYFNRFDPYPEKFPSV